MVAAFVKPISESAPSAPMVKSAKAADQPVISDAIKRKLRNERILTVVAPVLGVVLMLIIWEAISKGGHARLSGLKKSIN